ncbi:MAG: hypothetical protein AB1453_05285 [Chloroflexota bacterium]|jgi:hypothetical protein
MNCPIQPPADDIVTDWLAAPGVLNGWLNCTGIASTMLAETAAAVDIQVDCSE